MNIKLITYKDKRYKILDFRMVMANNGISDFD